MTREEIYASCLEAINKSNCLLLESATGTGKSKIAIDLVNHLTASVFVGKKTRMLLLVAKRVHKETWKEEFKKWGGINVDEVIIECYESMHKYVGKYFDYILCDEVHHVQSEARMEYLSKIKYKYMLGLSATIPRKLKSYFKYRYHSQIVSCDIIEAIEDEVLPEPQILLFPLMLDNRALTEEWEINGKMKGKGPTLRGTIQDLWKFKKQKNHAIIACTQLQKVIQYNKLIDWEKDKYMTTRSEAIKQSWLFHAGKRLEYLSDIKVPIVKDILRHLNRARTITFCKTIEQAELLGKNCIHSKNSMANVIYDEFNKKEINHITAVNILNENANLVDCKYGIFCNINGSEVIVPQRIGRSLRHKHPVIIFPYFKDTREEELIKKHLADYNREYIKVIHSIEEI